ncbi:MAG: YwiC-like family protein [Cyanobacteria bacterium P01_B01_bin.77]
MTTTSTNSSATPPTGRLKKQWYHPTVSPEHGAYVVLVLSFLTGAAAAQQWIWATTLALVCAYCGFQAEHPLGLQIRQRRSWKPRFLVWAGGYGGVAGAIALWLFWQQPENWTLLAICGAAVVATLIDGVSVWQRQQRAIWNELITFAAVCLSAPLAYAATVGMVTWPVIGLWLLNALFFSSAIFTVKLRKIKTASIVPGIIFHIVATGIVILLWQVHWLSPVTAAAFGVVLIKFGAILWQKDWYCHTKIQHVAQVETGSSLLFFAIAALSLLPPYLN